ncbi:putative tail fiber protein [Burkholderia phage BcepIL02]|uniref:Tail fiber protein n=1 Tax=Burkholderia phage BcepIL02 TaxID=2886898 RepID=C5IHQ0_9CAUD|nr:tail fiber protein [Burkholderia phage BcepIL02]ACR15051.1 putative tail fiber protein [Burkholderia phage BcepIL02]
MSLKLTNNGVSKLASSLGPDDTSLAVLPGDGSKFPALAAGDWFPATIIKSDAFSEIVKVTGRSGDTFTIVRGFESTAVLTFSPGDRVELRSTAFSLQNTSDVTPASANLDRTINLRSLYQILDLLEPVGTVKYWDSDDPPPPGYFVCNGQNGTPDWRDRFIVGAGASYARRATGGANTVTLGPEHMPVHSHGVRDPGHAHGVADPGHNHYVNDPGHNHNNGIFSRLLRPPYPGSITGSDTAGSGSEQAVGGGDSADIVPSGTGIWLNGSGTGISIYGSGTGIWLDNAGGGQTHENRPPYVAIPIIRKMVTAISTLG